MTTYIGVDVSKLKLDFCFLSSNSKPCHKQFDNNLRGFEDFLSLLTEKNIDNTHICLESTGVYGQAFTMFIYEHKWKVSVVNPARVKAFAQCEGLRNKTDKVDAALIARFAQSQHPPAWVPPASHQLDLQGLVRCWRGLQEDKQRVLNRKEGTPTNNQEIQIFLDQYTVSIQQHMDDLEKKILVLCQEHADLQQKIQLLESIPGVGHQTAITILAELPDITLFKNAKEVAAYAGLSPRKKESGTSVKGRGSLCKMGSSSLRKALFMPALVGQRYNPLLCSFATRLKSKGKNGKLVVAAVMRKLLHIIYGVLKTQKRFTAHYIC